MVEKIPILDILMQMITSKQNKRSVQHCNILWKYPHKIRQIYRMALILKKHTLLIYIFPIFTFSCIVQASDPDILTDFIIPPNYNNPPDGDFFTYNGLRGMLSYTVPYFTVTNASKAEFPAVDGQSVSFALLQFPANGVNPPHMHPRASELIYVLVGSLEVGFVDTTGKLFNQTLLFGDMFVFPKGLVHYQYNPDFFVATTAVSAFGSANAGTILSTTSLFGTNIDDMVLAESFKTDVATIQKIKAGLAQ